MLAGNQDRILINKETKEEVLSLCEINEHRSYTDLQRLNCYSVIWLWQGSGQFKVDVNQYAFTAGTMCFFTPYQPFQFIPDTRLKGMALHFHPDFFCIEKHKKEVSCNGVLFNNIYQSPVIQIEESDAIAFKQLMARFSEEMSNGSIGQFEMLVSYLKIFLIDASRIKIKQQPGVLCGQTLDSEPLVLQKLKDLIELHYREKHAPSDFAALLFISPKALGKLTKTHFNKTPTELIHERIVIEAKRELYLTNKPVKQIAGELGFDDEFYFSRFFKNNTSVSPQLYREKVGFDKAGNLSMD